MSADPRDGTVMDLERRLQEADSQLALYARDFRTIVEVEREKSWQLEVANGKLEQLNRLKSDFLVFISHELRTPLNAMSVVTMVGQEADSLEQAEVIELVRNGYERLRDLIEKGLEYFYWIALSEPPSPTVMDLRSIVERSTVTRADLHRARVDLRAGCCQEACLVRVQRPAIRRVLELLLDNALKFSYPGRATIDVWVRSANGRASLQVADRGCGFPPELASALFEPFTVLNTNHHSRGSGLSLAIASAIASAHGGILSAHSPGLGEGAIFTLELPTVEPSHDPV